jgi:nucleotide-binding universal stress UspA family protein
MPTVLLATDSVHTTAAGCDYLADRLDEGDTVVVLTVTAGVVSERDAGDAANVARTRLFDPTVETARRPSDGEDAAAVAAAITAVAADTDADEIVLGRVSGDPERAGEPPGSTARAVLRSASRPVVLVSP